MDKVELAKCHINDHSFGLIFESFLLNCEYCHHYSEIYLTDQYFQHRICVNMHMTFYVNVMDMRRGIKNHCMSSGGQNCNLS